MSDPTPGLQAPTRRTKATQRFDVLILEKAQEIVNQRIDKQAESNRKFYNGDHWQEAEGWVGPNAGGQTDQVGAATLQVIQREFVSRNAVAETVNRHVNGVLARELQWKFTVKRELEMVKVTDPDTGATSMEKEQPTADEQALIDEAEAALTAWWDRRQTPKILKSMLASVMTTKRGVLRMFIPTDNLDEEGNLPSGDLSQCLDFIWLQHLGVNDDTLDLQFPSATLFTDKNSRHEIGIFTYQDTPDLISEVLATGTVGQERAELTYLDDTGDTVLRVINQAGNVEEPLTMPLGGRLTMFEVTRPWLISPQVASLQKLLNLNLTMMQKNTVLGGFLERVFTNVKWPGEVGPDGEFVPKPVKVGPGWHTSLQGIEYEDDDGKKHMANPGVLYRDPVSTETFVGTDDSAYRTILQETQQLHYASAGDSAVSAQSRQQARESFRQDLQSSGGEVQASARWVLEGALAMASFFAGRAGEFEILRVDVQARIDSGPVTPDDMRVAADMKDKELWSKETAQSATGIEDVDAENQRIAKERAESAKADAENMARAQKLMDTINPPPVDPAAAGAPATGQAS